MKKQKNNSLDRAIEAVLFTQGEPIRTASIAKAVGAKRGDVAAGLKTLADRLERESGLRLLTHGDGDKVQLVTAPEHGPLIKKFVTESTREDLGRAALEVLAIIAYTGPINRSRIELIRGVNSTYTIRTLRMRGLIEECADKVSGICYDLAPEATRRLGVLDRTELPEWKRIRDEIESAEQALTRIA